MHFGVDTSYNPRQWWHGPKNRPYNSNSTRIRYVIFIEPPYKPVNFWDILSSVIQNGLLEDPTSGISQPVIVDPEGDPLWWPHSFGSHAYSIIFFSGPLHIFMNPCKSLEIHLNPFKSLEILIHPCKCPRRSPCSIHKIPFLWTPNDVQKRHHRGPISTRRCRQDSGITPSPSTLFANAEPPRHFADCDPN